MIDDKNSEIILCKGIKMDKNYENVLSYNEESMVNLCRNNQIYNAREYIFLGDTNYIDIECKYGVAMYANYVAFINPTFGNKWIFAWVTDVKLLNPSTSRIYFDIDVWSTWFSRFNVGKAFIEREHVEDDTIGKHTIPEGLETGDYVLNPATEGNISLGTNSYIVMGISEMPFPISIPSGNRQYGGVFSGLLYVAFENGGDAEHFITLMQSYVTQDIITTLFIVPRTLLANITFTTYTFDTDKTVRYAYVPYTDEEIVMSNTAFANKSTTLDGYSPVNNKLKCFPYQYLVVDNNAGSSQIYHYEEWQDTVDDKCNFTVIGVISPGCSIRMIPANYKNLSIVDNEGLDAPKLPTCGWTNDAYTNWLTQNAVNISLGLAQDVLSIGAGVATGKVNSFVGGFSGIAGTLAQVYEKSLTPKTAKGGVNQGDLTYAQRLGYNFYHYSIKNEYARIVDEYFSRFGYKVNEVKTPNLNSRSKFNFIKVGGMDELVTGNIPATDLEKINAIFRKGVTIFHNYNNFGDYTISNPIV